MYRVKLFNKISSAGTDVLGNAGGWEWSDSFDDYEAILVRSADLHEVDFPKGLRCIARAGAGVNNIPIDTCSERGIVVFNTPGANANAVKELVICSLLLSSRRIPAAIEWAKTLKGQGADISKLAEKGKGNFAGPEIAGKRLGVIGLGAIGVLVANAAVSLGMEVLGFDPYISIDAAWGLSRSVERAASMKQIFETCDYLTIHVPATPETKGMLNADSLATMKPGMRILNFARGELVNNTDLAKLLSCGAVSCFVTDFASEETLSMPNTIVLPHLGASTPESEDNCARMAAREIVDYLENGNISNSVNLPNVSMEREGKYRLCVINRNVPNIVGQISTKLASEGINIENMVNRSKKDYAYTLVDTNTELTPSMLEHLHSVEGVLHVRMIG